MYIPSMIPFIVQAKEGGNHFICPCCERDLSDENEIRQFQVAMKALSSSNSKIIMVNDSTKEARVSN